MADSGDIRFHNTGLWAGETGVIDRENAIIRGVSVITGNLTAEGHDLYVDNVLLDQLQQSAKSRGKIAVTLDHGSGVKDLNGYLTGFRMDGDKLRADWHLLKSHDETSKMLERAEVMPDCFGMSTAFRPPKGNMKGEAIGGGRMAARCEKLLSVDCVTRPAANEGLFSVKVDNPNNTNMADPNAAPQNQEPTLTDIVAAIQEISGRLDKQDEFNQSVSEQMGGNQPTLEELTKASDEELASIGLTRAEVNAAVAEAMKDEGHEADADADAQKGEGELAPAGADAAGADFSPAGASAGAELAALRKEVIELKKHNAAVALKAKNDAETIELQAIEDKAVKLATQRDEAIKLSEKLEAENKALKLAVKTGTRPVTAGVDNGVRMFNANGDGGLHPFQLRVKQLKETDKMSEAKAIQFASKENPASHADWINSQRNQVVTV